MATPTYLTASSAAPGTAATSITCTYPTSSSGDLIVLHVAFGKSGAGANAITTPSGWNLISGSDVVTTGGSTGISNAVFWRFRGAETSVSVSVASSSDPMFSAVAYDGTMVDPGGPISGFATTTVNASSTTLSTPTLAGTVDNQAVSFRSSHRVSFSSAYTHTWSGATERTDAFSDGFGPPFAVTAATLQSPTTGDIPSSSSTANTSVDGNYLAVVTVQPPQSATLDDSDAAAGTENAAVTGSIADSEVGSAADTATLGTSDADTGSATTESGSVTAQAPGDDAGSAVESASVTGSIDDGDTASGAEDAYVSNSVTPIGDTAGAFDDAFLVWQQYAADGAQGTENAFVIAVAYASDAATGVDSGPVLLTAEGDTAAGVENASKSIEGILSAPRVYNIDADDRTYVVPADPRTLSIDAEYRTYVVMTENPVNSNAQSKFVPTDYIGGDDTISYLYPSIGTKGE